MQEKKKYPWTFKRIAACVALALIALLLVLLLVSAAVATPQSNQFFRVCLGLIIAVPIAAFVIIWMHSRISGGRAVGDPELPSRNENGLKRQNEDNRAQ